MRHALFLTFRNSMFFIIGAFCEILFRILLFIWYQSNVKGCSIRRRWLCLHTHWEGFMPVLPFKAIVESFWRHFEWIDETKENKFIHFRQRSKTWRTTGPSGNWVNLVILSKQKMRNTAKLFRLLSEGAQRKNMSKSEKFVKKWHGVCDSPRRL